MDDTKLPKEYPMSDLVAGDPDADGRYLKASEPDTWEKPEEVDTWGNYFLRPDKPLLQRHLELCRLAAHGKTNAEIAEKLGYTPSRVSVLLGNSRIRDQINIYRDRLFGVDVKTRLKELAPDAADVIQGILNDDNLSIKEKEKAAMWVLEKVDGKAAQQHDHTGSVDLSVFYDKLDQLNGRQEPVNVAYRVASGNESAELVGETQEVEPAPAVDNFTAWLDANKGSDNE